MATENETVDDVGSPPDRISQILRDLRECKSSSRYGLCKSIFPILNYSKHLSLPQMDAFLIKATYEAFGKETIDADVVLMALGLLNECSYQIAPQITQRRIDYLRKSEYLSYDNAAEKDQKHYRDNLRKTEEDNRLSQLAVFLFSLQNNVEEFLKNIGEYMDSKSRASFQTPSYAKRRKGQDNITVVTKYLIPGKVITTEHSVSIGKDNKYEIKINVKERMAGMASAALCVFVLFSAFYHNQSYQLQIERQKNSYASVEETSKQDYDEIPLAQQEDLSNIDD